MPEPDESSLIAVALARPEAARAAVGAWEAGAAVLPLDPRAPGPEVRRLLEEARPTHLLDADGLRPLRGGEPVAGDVAAVVATSGTTGTPRCVELTRAGLAASARAVSDALGADGSDTWLCCVPVHHVAGLAIVARAWVTGAGLVVHPGFDPGAVAAAAGEGATLVSLVPTMLQRLLDGGGLGPGFRHVLLGGGPVPDALLARAAREGVGTTTTYGLTETWGGVVHDGHALPGAQVRLGAGGEILVRGPMVMRGYRRRPDATAAVLDGGGWLHTGDVGAQEPGGRLRVVDRLRDQVISGGVNVSPTEVERVLAGHPKVADVCVVGLPDPEWGERVVACVVPVVPGDPPGLDELRAFGAGELARTKLPRQVIVLDSVPRSSLGKPLRARLRARLEGHRGGGSPVE